MDTSNPLWRPEYIENYVLSINIESISLIVEYKSLYGWIDDDTYVFYDNQWLRNNTYQIMDENLYSHVANDMIIKSNVINYEKLNSYFLQEQTGNDNKEYNITLFLPLKFNLVTSDAKTNFRILARESLTPNARHSCYGMLRDNLTGTLYPIVAIQTYDNNYASFTLYLEGFEASFTYPDFTKVTMYD